MQAKVFKHKMIGLSKSLI